MQYRNKMMTSEPKRSFKITFDPPLNPADENERQEAFKQMEDVSFVISRPCTLELQIEIEENNETTS